jgi:hypothetical protein
MRIIEKLIKQLKNLFFTLTATRLTDELLKQYGFEENHNDLLSIGRANSIGFSQLEAMKINEGYWMILSIEQSGKETGRINLGKYLYKHEIKKLIQVLKYGR